MKSRLGLTIIESLVALTLMAAAIAGAAQLLSMCARERQNANRYFLAQIETANVLEHVAAMKYDKVTTDALKDTKLSQETLAAIPGANVRIDVADAEPSDLPHKRVTAEITWDDAGQQHSSARLTSWKFPPQEAQP